MGTVTVEPNHLVLPTASNTPIPYFWDLRKTGYYAYYKIAMTTDASISRIKYKRSESIMIMYFNMRTQRREVGKK